MLQLSGIFYLQNLRMILLSWFLSIWLREPFHRGKVTRGKNKLCHFIIPLCPAFLADDKWKRDFGTQSSAYLGVEEEHWTDGRVLNSGRFSFSFLLLLLSVSLGCQRSAFLMLVERVAGFSFPGFKVSL